MTERISGGQTTLFDRPKPMDVVKVVGIMAAGIVLKQPFIEWVAGTAGAVEFVTWAVHFAGVGASRTLPPRVPDTNIANPEDSIDELYD
jgi:hypothetical protein